MDLTLHYTGGDDGECEHCDGQFCIIGFEYKLVDKDGVIRGGGIIGDVCLKWVYKGIKIKEYN